MRRVFVISDLHIGGAENPMLGHPDFLLEFLEQVAAYVPKGGEEVELVINGDFVDFLAEEPYESWTATESDALTKLDTIVGRQPKLFKALAQCAKLRCFTILLGNHDLELAFPRVREALFRELGTDPHRCHFIQNNETYRIGDLLIEHGNRYDPWNAIDHDGLREIISCASRGENPPPQVPVICPGSRLVTEVMNPLKERYHFVDLLKPEDKVVSLLLAAFEPQLIRDLGTLYSGARSYFKQVFRKARWKVADYIPTLGERRFVATAASEDELPADVESAFAEELQIAAETGARRQVGVGEVLRRAFLEDRTDNLRAMLERGDRIDPKRIRKLQVALAAKLENDKTFDENDKDSAASRPYVEAAQEMVLAQVAKVIIMGHTHLRRNIPLDRGGRYLNTGTWADLIEVDKNLLDENSRTAFEEWLKRLATNQLEGIRGCNPTFADVRIGDDLKVIDDGQPMLRNYRPGDTIA